MGNMSSREFVDTIMRDLLGTRVFVFTPKGEVGGWNGFAYIPPTCYSKISLISFLAQIKNLPKGATVIDFAYLIHTEVGNKMVAAKVSCRPFQ